MKELEKDEYGLYIHSNNYAECRASIIISEILKEVNKPKTNWLKNIFFALTNQELKIIL